MTNEELLKAISNMLKSNEDYLNENKDVFLGIQGRLLKAIGYNPEILEKDDDFKIPNSHHSMITGALGHTESPLSQHSMARDVLGLPTEMNDLEPPGQAPTMGGNDMINSDSHHDRMTSATLRQFKPKHISEIASHIYDALDETHDEVESTSEEESDTERYDNHLKHMTNMKYLINNYSNDKSLEKNDKSKKDKVSRTGYRDWQPKEGEGYTPEQTQSIKEHMDQGFSHREAERFANAHDQHKDFQSALDSKVNPSSEYSDKFHEIMKDVGLKHKQRAAEYEGKTAEAGINPQKYASHRDLKAHEQAYGDYDKDYKEFLSGLDDQDLHPLDYDEAVSKWQSDWHEKNPEAKEEMINAADAGKVYDEAKETRKDRIKEGAMNIITSTASGAGQGSTGEFSQEAGGGSDLNPSAQAAAQMIGGAKGERGYESGTVKDPNAIFSEQNPEFVAELKRKFASKLGQNPEAKERHDAMPPRNRGPQPGKVKTLTPEEIKVQYGDKYKVKGDA